MLNKLASLHRVAPFLLALASLLIYTLPLRAEPVVKGATQSDNRLIDASQWLPSEHHSPVNVSDQPATTSGGPSAPTVQPELLPRAPSPTRPLAAPLERSNEATPTRDSGGTPALVTASQSDDNTPDRDIRGAVKEVVRPLYEDLSSSDAAQALRGLQAELGLDKQNAFNAPKNAQENRQEGSGLPRETANWDGQTNQQPPRSAAQVERDKVLASVMMDKLIEEVTPWAIGLVALYGLFYVIKLGLAYVRHRSNRRRISTVRRRRRKTSP